MERKQAMLSLLALIVVTWFLVSSLTEINNFNPSGSSNSGTGTSGSGGTLSGGGSGTGSNGGGFGFSFPSSSLSFTFPSINLNFLKPFTNAVAWILSHIPLPNARLPTLKLPSTHYPGNLSPGSSGGGSGTTSVNQNPSVIPLLTNEYLLIIIAIISAIFIIFMVMRNVTVTKSGKKNISKSQSVGIIDVPNVSSDTKLTDGKIDPTHGRKFLFSKISTPLRGWGGVDSIVIPIPEELPLVWSDSTPLSISVSVELNTEFNGVPFHGKDVTLPYGLNELSINIGENNTVLELLGIPYEEHVRDSTIINIPEKIRSEISSKTLKEVYSMPELRSEFNDPESIREAITICERAIYGKKMLKREEYERFLKLLGKGFMNPSITWMVRKNANQ